jgi:hypothetical protein
MGAGSPSNNASGIASGAKLTSFQSMEDTLLKSAAGDVSPSEKRTLPPNEQIPVEIIGVLRPIAPYIVWSVITSQFHFAARKFNLPKRL